MSAKGGQRRLRRWLAAWAMVTAIGLHGDETLPADVFPQIAESIFANEPATVTAVSLSLSDPRKAVGVVRGADGAWRRGEFTGLQADWTYYSEDGVMITLRSTGNVFLFEQGRLVAKVPGRFVAWPEGLPQAAAQPRQLLRRPGMGMTPSAAELDEAALADRRTADLDAIRRVAVGSVLSQVVMPEGWLDHSEIRGIGFQTGLWLVSVEPGTSVFLVTPHPTTRSRKPSEVLPSIVLKLDAAGMTLPDLYAAWRGVLPGRAVRVLEYSVSYGDGRYYHTSARETDRLVRFD